MIDFSKAEAMGFHLLGMWPLCKTAEDQALLIREHSCRLTEQTKEKESHQNTHRAFSYFMKCRDSNKDNKLVLT